MIYGMVEYTENTFLKIYSWYMRKILIESMLSRGFHALGQARIDTKLYDEPLVQKKPTRGRPKKFGEKLTRKRVAHLKKN